MSAEMKHTPASEWKLKIRQPKGNVCGRVSVIIGGEVAYSAVYSEGEERAVADAHVIYASLYLLAACKESLSFVEANLGKFHLQALYTQLEQAIAKASSLSPLTEEQK